MKDRRRGEGRRKDGKREEMDVEGKIGSLGTTSVANPSF